MHNSVLTYIIINAPWMSNLTSRDFFAIIINKIRDKYVVGNIDMKYVPWKYVFVKTLFTFDKKRV